MKNCDFYKEFDGFVFRHIRWEDADAYYRDGFLNPDLESLRLTGSGTFSEAQVLDFFYACCQSSSRADFLLLAPDGRVVGESVLNEYNPQENGCNFRICIFSSEFWGKGLGTEMIRYTLEYGFAHWGLDRLTLEVFSFNPRAQRAYLRAGFRVIDTFPNEEGEGEILVMELCRHEWKQRNAR